ncbi:hypothetical protein QFC22_001537 [Naganishia vaughanmartiniae]|uniref:Uncharacterized protein n=1 Tax=Naganishia vaughanmartiniae TaxID=1424756 RepID=A0ACC2XH45_9TREE|nr:hypothetical protein QFC22_001537 [Naganishia vaughanmartiniae]
MAASDISDEQVWKQVRKCLSLDDEDETTPVPPFLFRPIKDFMLSNPEDDEFVIECSVPGRSDQPYGEVTCLEDLCFMDIRLKHDDRKPDGGVSIGLGSLDPFREHCKESGHKKARETRHEIRKKREARKAREAARNSTPPVSSRSHHQSSAMLAKTGSGSFGSLNERKPDIKPKPSDIKSKPSASNVKPAVDFSNSKPKISSGFGNNRVFRGSKRPIFVLSDSDDDDDLQVKSKRLKPTIPDVKPALPSIIPDVKPAVPASNQMQISSSSAATAVPSAPVASGPVTVAELDAAEQIAMCKKATTMAPFLTFPSKFDNLKQYLHYVGACQGINRPIAMKAVALFPELLPYASEIREAVRNTFRQQGRTLPDEQLEAPSAMSMLSNSLALQNMFPFNQPGLDLMGRMLGSASGVGLFGEDEAEAAENRRLAGRPADDLQTFFKDSLDDFSENVTVSDAATKLGLAHMNDLLPGMRVPLMPHQIIGVQWMVEKEKSKNHGGILADAMGLGKTIQTIATMIANPSTDPTCKTTLIVAPLALLEQWKLEIENKTYGQLRAYVFHGSNKNITKKQLKKYDVVLTTYGTLVQQFPPPEKKKKPKKPNDFIDDSGENDSEFTSNKAKHGPLALIYWYRVVLDEAAQIRNKRTRAAKACFELDALNRWVLSGTLIVNSLEVEKRAPKTACNRIQAILKFGCMRRTKDTLIDGKPLLQLPEKKVEIAEEDFDEDERALYTAIEQKVKLRFNRYLRAGTVLKNMRNVLIMILRLRQVCSHATLIVRKPGEAGHHDDLLLEADDERLTNHKAFRDNSQIDRDDEVGRARVFGGDALVEKLKAKLALRQTEDEAQQANGEDGDFQCVICFEPFLDNERITSCLHSCCLTCITDITKKHQDEVDSGMVAPGTKAHCPMCRESIDGDNIFVAAAFEAEVVVKSDDVKAEQDLLDELDLGSLTRSKGKGKGRAVDLDEDEEEPIILPSAKMRKTSSLVTGWLAANDEDKIVIFSQFVTFIELVRQDLEMQGIDSYTYTGSMSKIDRDATIANFTNPRKRVRVILISTKAGGVGLNLTIANKAICLDLAWNNATEQQAIDRIHRIGQTKPVEVHRIVIPNSVEQRILALQEKKAALAEGAYGEGKGVKLGRLSVQDLMALFDVRRDRADEEL